MSNGVSITAVENLGKVKPGDVLVMRVPREISLAEVDACQKHMAEEFPDNQVVLVIEGFELEKRR